MTVQEIYDYNKRLNLPMLSGYTPEGDIDFWGVYRENFSYFDRLFYKTYRSFILFNSDGDTTGEVSTDFRNDCYAWLLANDKNYTELFRMQLVDDEEYNFMYNYDMAETYSGTSSSTGSPPGRIFFRSSFSSQSVVDSLI